MKTKRILVIGIAAAVTLLGCSSFNTYTYPPMALASPAKQPAYEPMVLPPPRGVPENCVFKLPDLGSTPEIPLDDLARINPHDAASIDAIQQRHIDELRTYITNTRRSIERAFHAYQLSCSLNVVVG